MMRLVALVALLSLSSDCHSTTRVELAQGSFPSVHAARDRIVVRTIGGERRDVTNEVLDVELHGEHLAYLR